MHERNQPATPPSTPTTPATPATPAAPLLSRKSLFDSMKAVIGDDPSIVEDLSVTAEAPLPGKP